MATHESYSFQMFDIPQGHIPGRIPDSQNIALFDPFDRAYIILQSIQLAQLLNLAIT